MIELLSPNKLSIASGTSYGALPNNEHAALAVKAALKKMMPCTVGSVLLFLTTGYAQNPQEAIKEAVKAAGTPQVFGCTASGLLSDQEWLLDVEGAVAMVFPREMSLQPAQVMLQQGLSPELLITLASPNAATIAVNSHKIPQMGALSTDEYGHGPYSVWQSGRIVEQEYTHLGFPETLKSVTKVSDSIRPISDIQQINRSEGHKLIELNQQPALDNLLQNLPDNLRSLGLQQPYSLLCALSENAHKESIEQGHFKLQHIVANDTVTKEIHLSGTAKAGRHIFWAIRDEQKSQDTMREKLEQARDELGEQAKFALMFANIGRGPEFYNGQDRDLELFKSIFPNVPMVGFYSNGEIAPGHRYAGLIHHYATVFSLFA